jgi:hypothetical protein
LSRIPQIVWVAVLALASCGMAFASAEKQAIQVELDDVQPVDQGGSLSSYFTTVWPSLSRR